MKKMLVLATSAMMLVACREKPGYEITGTVNNPALEGKCVYLYPYGDAEAAPLDSAVVTNGTFVLKGTQDSSALRTLKFLEEVVPRSYAPAGENGVRRIMTRWLLSGKKSGRCVPNRKLWRLL